MSWLARLAAPLGLKIAAGAAIAAALAALLLGLRNAGRQAERAEQLGRAAAVARQRRRIEDATNRLGDGAVDRRLREWARPDDGNSL